TITVNGTNDVPTIIFGGDNGADANAAVSEEGLGFGILPPHGPGIPDDAGAPDTTNSAKDSGTFTVHDVDAGDTVTVKLGAPSETLTSAGQEVHWSVSGDEIGRASRRERGSPAAGGRAGHAGQARGGSGR